MPWLELAFVPLGFLCGSVLFSYHIPLWLKKIDIVKLSGDHNPGSANAFRFAGVHVGLLCLVMDAIKGALPVWLFIRYFGIDTPVLPAVMLAPLAGHAYTPWYRFKGGKAIATAFGVLIGLFPFVFPLCTLIFWYLFFSLIIIIHPNERRSVYTFVLYAACGAGGAVYTRHPWLALGCALVAVIPVIKNAADIKRAESEQRRVAHEPQGTYEAETVQDEPEEYAVQTHREGAV